MEKLGARLLINIGKAIVVVLGIFLAFSLESS